MITLDEAAKDSGLGIDNISRTAYKLKTLDYEFVVAYIQASQLSSRVHGNRHNWNVAHAEEKLGRKMIKLGAKR